jgi:hypothetical protein
MNTVKAQVGEGVWYLYHEQRVGPVPDLDSRNLFLPVLGNDDGRW